MHMLHKFRKGKKKTFLIQIHKPGDRNTPIAVVAAVDGSQRWLTVAMAVVARGGSVVRSRGVRL